MLKDSAYRQVRKAKQEISSAVAFIIIKGEEGY